MKQNTFDPCKDHENGHFGWCLLCEIEQLRWSLQNNNLHKEIQRLTERCAELTDLLKIEHKEKMDLIYETMPD